MSTTSNLASCADGNGKEFTGRLPVDPFRSLYVHFGMLLGVDDFEQMQAYDRGKAWLHGAWLHREGTVWGLAVKDESPEIRVERGFALDAAGRELFLDEDHCLNLGLWFDQHEAEHGLKLAAGEITFDAHVVIQAKDCLERQVPALLDPCEGSGQTTAFSRVVETVELAVAPGPAPDGDRPYRRLRVLFGLKAPTDPNEVVALKARNAVLAKPAADRPAACLSAFREMAALDTMELTPGMAEGGGDLLFPAGTPAPLTLAVLRGVNIKKAAGGFEVSIAGVHNEVRRAHVATSTIQELLCGPGCPEPAGVGSPASAPGATMLRGSVVVSDTEIAFEVSQPLLKASVTPDAFSVSDFDVSAGWSQVAVTGVSYDVAAGLITLTLGGALGTGYVRLIARGTGPTPLLDRSRRPLSGADTDVFPANPHDGKDFVHMEKRS